MRGQFGWDYPPGVSGNEPQIAGYAECPECGDYLEDNGECPSAVKSNYTKCPFRGQEPEEDYDRD